MRGSHRGRIGVTVEGAGVLGSGERMTPQQAYFTFQELANRWRCSRGTVRNRLRACGAPVLDFASAPGKRSKKLIPASTIEAMELKKTKRLA
jgi:hypothetical protein